jgi:hypothetical protein
MGLLDALFSNDSGGGLLGGLPQSWQWQNPAEANSTKDFLTALRQDPSMGNNLAAPQSPFGAVPNFQQAPQSVFASGAAPMQAGLDPSLLTSQPPAQPPQQPSAQPAPAPAQPSAAPMPTPAPQNNPINTIPVGNYQMPQFGTAAQYTPQQQPTSTDISAQSRQPQPEQALPPAFGGGGYLDRLHNGGSLIGSMFQSGTPQQQNLTAQYHAIRQTLESNGESPQAASSKAMLAVMNPEAGKTIISEALTNKEKWGEIGSDSFGNKTMGWINDRNQTINGKAVGEEGANGASTGFLAPGVKSIDSSLTGTDYLKQFSPEVQAAVQNYVDGKSMPTGNPRKGFTQTVKMIAQKYGADNGQPVDDATYSARRTMRNQLSSSAPSSLGGQINIGNTAAGHLADLSQKALELGNVDTGIAPLTSAVNSVRGLGTEQAAKMEALKGAAQHYGQEITKFYAGSPGGTAERDRFIESVNGARSPKELAAILATEGELMRSRLDALGGQIKGVLGEEGTKQYPVLRPDGQAALAKVEENVSRLKGGQSAPSVAPLAVGQSTTHGGVTIKRVN